MVKRLMIIHRCHRRCVSRLCIYVPLHYNVYTRIDAAGRTARIYRPISGRVDDRPGPSTLSSMAVDHGRKLISRN